MPELSPAAQAVLDAAVLPCSISKGIAAALLAAADQVAPKTALDMMVRGSRQWHRNIRQNEIRLHLLAIAEELQAH